MERRLPFVLSVVSLFAFSLLFANVTLAQTSSCARAAPLLEYSNPSSGSFSETANSQSSGITVAHTYTIKVTNKDGAGCGGSTFQFNFGTPPLYVTLDGKNQPFFASIKTIPAGQSVTVTGNTGNVGLNLVKSPQTFEIPVVVSRLLEAKTPSLDSTTVKSVTQGSYTMTVGFDKGSYAGGGTAAYFGTLKKNGVAFSGKAVSVQILKTKSGTESIESQTSLTTASDGSFSGKIAIDRLASKYRVLARYTDSSSPTSPVTVTVINSFCGSSDCSKSFGSVPAATNENPSSTIKLKVVVTRELSCLNTKGYEPVVTIRSQTGTGGIVSGQELTFDVNVLNREIDCPDERFSSPLVGIADRNPLRPIGTEEDTGAKSWEIRIDGNSPSRLPTTSTKLPGISKASFFLWQDFGIKDYTLKSYASASHRLTLKAPLAPGEVGNTRNFAFCISSISQVCQTILVKVLPSSTGDKTPPSIISFSTNPSPAVVSKPVTFVAKVSDNAGVDRVVFSVDKNKNGGFDTSEIQTKTLSPKITSSEVSADSPVTFDNKGNYNYKIDVFDTSNNPSSSEGTIIVGDGTTPPLSVGGTSNTGSEGDKIELLLDKGSYSTDDVMTITGTLTLKSETSVSPYVDIEFFDSSGKSIAKSSRPVTSSGTFAYKPSVKTNLGISATDQVKVVASYTSAFTSKTLVSVEKLISIGGKVSPGTPPSGETGTPPAVTGCNKYTICGQCTPDTTNSCGWSTTAKSCKTGSAQSSSDNEATLDKKNWAWYTSKTSRGSNPGLSCEEIGSDASTGTPSSGSPPVPSTPATPPPASTASADTCSQYSVCNKCTPAAESCGWDTSEKKCKKGSATESADKNADMTKGNWVWYTSKISRGSNTGLSCEDIGTATSAPSQPSSVSVNAEAICNAYLSCGKCTPNVTESCGWDKNANKCKHGTVIVSDDKEADNTKGNWAWYTSKSTRGSNAGLSCEEAGLLETTASSTPTTPSINVDKEKVCNAHAACNACAPDSTNACGWDTSEKKCKTGSSSGSSDGKATLDKKNWAWYTSKAARVSNLGVSCEEVSV